MSTTDEKYINQELAPYLAEVEAATTPLAAIDKGSIGQGAVLGRQLATARSYLGGFLVRASALVPPTAWKASFEALVAIVTDMAAAVDELQIAVDANQTEMFAQAHGKLAATLARHAEWKATLARGLAAAHITQAPLPPPREPTTKPPIDPTPHPCGGPCPCTDVSIEKTGGVITKCTLSRDYGVSGVHCANGPVLFDAKTGELAECTAAALFPPYASETPGTPKDRVVLCGPGPVTKGAFGVSSCILASDVVVGPDAAKTTIAKTARVFFSAPFVIERAVMPDGTSTCFDVAGKSTACP